MLSHRHDVGLVVIQGAGDDLVGRDEHRASVDAP